MRHNMRATNGITHAQRIRLRRAGAYRGLFSRVAKELGLERSHVRRVAFGERQSKKVEAALRAEIARIEKEAA